MCVVCCNQQQSIGILRRLDFFYQPKSEQSESSSSNGYVQQTNGHDECGQQREIGIQVVPEATTELLHRCAAGKR